MRTSASWKRRWSSLLALTSWLAFSAGCLTRTVIQTEKCPLALPAKPIVSFQVCGDSVCLSPENARELALWLLALAEWENDYRAICQGESDA